MYPSSAVGRGNPFASPRPSDLDERAERRVASNVRDREPDASATDRQTHGVCVVSLGQDDGCQGGVDLHASTAGDAGSSIEVVPTVTSVFKSVTAAISWVRRLARSASLTHLRGWRRHCSAQSRVGPDLELTRSGEGAGDKQLPRVVRTWARFRLIVRPRADGSADEGDRPVHPCHARWGRWSPRGRFSCEPREATPRDGRRRVESCVVPRDLVGGADAIERAPELCESRTGTMPHPATFYQSPRVTPSPSIAEPALGNRKACRRLRRRDVDGAGAGCRQAVDGLGDEAANGAGRLWVVP
jgi:hypothetical protein